jgi:S-adenosylmethionine:tRNA ribosyltransferase-isomerase
VKTSDFDYELPGELIAQQPLPDRAASRMLVVNRATGELRHDQFRNLRQYLQPGDLLVLNDTKVIPARIWSESPALEFLLVEDLGNHRWSALVKPGRKAKPGTALVFADGLTAVIEGDADFGGRVLRFTGDVETFLAKHGAAPLPPYIKRPISSVVGRGDPPGRPQSYPATDEPAARPYPPDQVRAQDLPRYQTVFAQMPGAIAAPTAGLHFTPELLAQFDHAFLTLHVGIGTFRPVKVENVEDHPMHAERFTVSEAAAAQMRAANRIVAVGTTVVRTLESLGEPRAATGATDIFIRPPFEFRVVDVLLTNFHLPRSTLLMLVSAFAGRELILRAYAEAIRDRYRFYSYGDCMLIL